MNSSHWGAIAQILIEKQIPFLPVSGRLLLSIKGVALFMGVSESAVTKWLQLSHCPVIQPGQMILIDPDEFPKWFMKGSHDGEEKTENEIER